MTQLGATSGCYASCVPKLLLRLPIPLSFVVAAADKAASSIVFTPKGSKQVDLSIPIRITETWVTLFLLVKLPTLGPYCSVRDSSSWHHPEAAIRYLEPSSCRTLAWTAFSLGSDDADDDATEKCRRRHTRVMPLDSLVDKDHV